MCKQSLLVGGTELQQECLLTELSALASLEELRKLAPETPVSFGNKTLEFKEQSNTISLRVQSALYMELLQRHNLEEVEPITSLEQDELEQTASGQDCALEAENQELFSKTVGELEWLARACRPDLSFVVHSLTQSFDTPTKGQEMQLHKVLALSQRHSALQLKLASNNQDNPGGATACRNSGFLINILDRSIRSNQHSFFELVGSLSHSFLQNKRCTNTRACRT